MEIELSPWQTQVWDDKHRFRIVAAGRRSGKSVLSQLTVITWANTEPGNYWIVCPTYRQAKQIHWDGLRQFVPEKLVESKNEVELSIILKNGSKIELKGSENPDNLRGVKLRGLIIDEIASIRNWQWLWSEVLRPTLTDYAAPVLFISTPKGYNHFYDLYQTGLIEGTYKSFRFTSYDNPYILRDEIDEAKKELTEDTFQQEYMADFRRFSGAIFKNFNREINIIDSFDIPNTWARGRGFDFGSDDPTASLRIAIDDNDNWFFERTYKRSDSIQGHSDILRSQDYGLDLVPCWGDPTGGQWFQEFEQKKFHIESAVKEDTGQKSWVNFGYELIDGRFKQIPGHKVYLPNGKVIENAPKAFILNTPENKAFIKEIELAEWKRNNDGQTQPMIDDVKDPDGHFDLIACARYFAVSYRKQKTNYDVVEKNSTLRRKWAI